MREIKFRGQRVDGKGWVYGSLVIDFESNDFFICFFEIALICKETNTYEPKMHMVNVIPETVGQYTGLKDKDGIEVYEGDVTNKFETVVFDGGIFYLEDTLYKLCDKSTSCVERRNIVGNIHDMY